MARWDQKWNCSHIWADESDPHVAALKLSHFLTRQRDKPRNESVYEHIDEIIDQLDAIASDDEATEQHFNTVLSYLYDFADANAVWIVPS